MEQKEKTTQPNRPQPQRPRQPRLRLPFDNRKQDFAGWIYDNRVGMCITTIVFLVAAIIFVVSKIDTSSYKAPDTIYIDLSQVELLEKERDRLQEEIRHKQNIDWSKVRNRTSNENALNENIKDTKGTNVSELNAAAEAMEREMKANREAYEQGLREVEKIGASKPEQGTGKSGSQEQQDSKYKGNVTVSFSFKDPVRYSRNLIIPAYRCEGGGEVIIEAVLNQSGKVISATVLSGGDGCMQQTARNAALNSTFNIDSNAPAKHRGTISYIFIPQ